MIIGIGTDIVKVDRIKDIILKNSKFLTKVYTDSELNYANYNESISYQTLSGFWAAKEALVKALGTGFRGIYFKDIEVLHDENNKPIIRINNNKIDEDILIHISISHEKEFAIAYCILERK